MALRTSLTISGDAQGAAAALAETEASLDRVAAAASRTGGAMAVSAKQAQAGYINFGRQIQDVAVSIQTLGIARIGTVVAQQGGQVADAVAQMGGRFSGLASFLAGPWGTAVLVASSVLLNSLLPALLGTEDAASKAKAEAFDFSNGLDVLSLSADKATAAMEQLAKATEQAIAVRGDFLAQQGQIANQAAQELQARIAKNQADLNATNSDMVSLFPKRSLLQNMMVRSQLQAQIEADQKSFEFAQRSVSNASIAASERRVNGQLDPVAAARDRFNVAVGQLIKRREKSILANDPLASATDPDFLSEADFEKQYRIEAQRKKAAEDAARAANRKSRATGAKKPKSTAGLESFVDSAENRIASIADQFSDLPPTVIRANNAMRDLNKTADDLKRKSPPDYARLKPQFDAAGEAIKNSLNKPFDDFVKAQRESAAVDQLLLAGRQDEAEALKVILQLQREQDPLSKEQLATVLATIEAQRRNAAVIRDQNALIQANVDAVSSLRGALEQTAADAIRGKFSAQAVVNSIGNSFITIASKRIVESMFGDALRALEEKATGQDKVVEANDAYVKSIGGVETAFKSLGEVTADLGRRIAGIAAPDASASSSVPAGSSGGAKSGGYFDPKTGEWVEAPIEVQAKPSSSPAVLGGAPGLGFMVDLVAVATRGVGLNISQSLGVVLKSALGKLEQVLPNALTSAFTGKAAAQLILGGNGGGAGSLIGGILGEKFGEKLVSKGLTSISSKLGALGGPVASILGGLAGGLIGKLFSSTKQGYAVVTNNGVTSGGNKTELIAQAKAAGSSIQSAIDKIAQQLGATVGSYSVSIAKRSSGWIHVDGSGAANVGDGNWIKKAGANAVYNGKDEEAALQAALANAIGDGAIQGISAAVQRALTSSSDIDKAVAEALKVQQVELLVGGLGAQFRKAFTDFEAQAKERLRIANQYGFDVVAIEKRNAEDRLKLNQKLIADQVGSLQQLIDEMTSGSLFEGSAVDRRAALKEQIDAARADANAGVEGAADKLAKLLQDFNAASRDAYGTTGGYASDRSTVLDVARDAISQANQRVNDAAKATDPALATTNAALDENNDQNAQILAAIGISNETLNQLLAAFGRGNQTALANLARTSGL